MHFLVDILKGSLYKGEIAKSLFFYYFYYSY